MRFKNKQTIADGFRLSISYKFHELGNQLCVSAMGELGASKTKHKTNIWVMALIAAVCTRGDMHRVGSEKTRFCPSSGRKSLNPVCLSFPVCYPTACPMGKDQ